MSAIASRLSSPRFQRRLTVAAASVFALGVIVFAATVVWPGPKRAVIAPPTVPVQIPVKEKYVPFEPAARKVGERFIETAVTRRNLGASWKLVAPALKDGYTLERWKTGAIPVIPYPADTRSPAPVKIDYSYKDKALLMILLTPKRGVHVKPQLFLLGLHAFGRGASRHWLVDYWAPYGVPKIPEG